jgi:hypothetical protein
LTREATSSMCWKELQPSLVPQARRRLKRQLLADDLSSAGLPSSTDLSNQVGNSGVEMLSRSLIYGRMGSFRAIRGQKWNRDVAGRVRSWWRKVNLAVEVWNLTDKEPTK